MMWTKSVEYKLKCLLVGLLSGVLISFFVPHYLQAYPNQLDGSGRNGIALQFGQYSSWPLFLTDPSFDLVKTFSLCLL